MAKDRTLLAVMIIGVVGILIASGNLPGLSGAIGGPSDTQACGVIELPAASDNCGDSATLSLDTELLGSSANVETTVYAEVTKTNGETVWRSTTASGGSVDWSNFVVGERIETLYAFNESGSYPIDAAGEGGIPVDAATVTETVKSADQVATGSLTTTFRDDGDDISSITLSSGQQETVDALRFTSDNQEDYFNGYLVAVDFPTDSNVSIDNWNNAEAVRVPDSVAESYDDAYVVYTDAGQGSTPNGVPFEDVDSSSITFDADDTNDPSESITFLIKDLQAFEDEDGTISFDVEDEDDNDLGVADVTQSLTVN